MGNKLNVSKIFTERLVAAREKCGFSQSELAEKSGIQQSTLSQYEGGLRRPSIINLRRLSRALTVSVDYLVSNTEDPLPRSPANDKLVDGILALGPKDRKMVSALVESLLSRKK